MLELLVREGQFIDRCEQSDRELREAFTEEGIVDLEDYRLADLRMVMFAQIALNLLTGYKIHTLRILDAHGNSDQEYFYYDDVRRYRVEDWIRRYEWMYDGLVICSCNTNGVSLSTPACPVLYPKTKVYTESCERWVTALIEETGVYNTRDIINFNLPDYLLADFTLLESHQYFLERRRAGD